MQTQRAEFSMSVLSELNGMIILLPLIKELQERLMITPICKVTVILEEFLTS